MSRPTGSFETNKNYNVSIRKPLDTRSVVTDYNDLTTSSIWKNSNGASVVYNGMMVAVVNPTVTDKNGIYYFFDPNFSALKGGDVTTENNWYRIANYDDIGSAGDVTGVTEEYVLAEIQKLREEVRDTGYITEDDLNDKFLGYVKIDEFETILKEKLMTYTIYGGDANPADD